MPKNKRDKDVSSDEEVEQNNDTSVLQQAPTGRPRKFPKVRKPRIRNRILSPKQVHKLADMESHQIARNHTFKELEFIIKSLTTIYEKLRAPKPQEKDGASQKSSQNSAKKGSKSRVRSLARGRKKSLRKRGKIFSISRRPSVGPNLKAKIQKGLAERKKKAKDDELDEEKLAKYKMFEVEKALEKTDFAFRTHKNFKEKEKARWRSWEQTQREKSTESLINMKSLLPKNLKIMTEEQVAKELEGNIYLARRFVRHQVFQLFNMNLDRIQRIHPADFNNKYHYGSLDIKELRALYAHTKGLKRTWRTGLKKKLFEMTEKEQSKTLKPRDIEHPAYRGEPEHNHDRKPQVVKLLDSRPVYDADDFTLGKSTQRRASRAGTLVARELQEVLSTDGNDAPAPSQIRRRQSMIEERRRKEEEKEKRRPSEIESFYLHQRAPDDPVDYSSLSRTSRRKSNSISLKGREMTSDGEKIHRRPKDNIFADHERRKEGGTLADDEDDSDPDDLFIRKQKKKEEREESIESRRILCR